MPYRWTVPLLLLLALTPAARPEFLDRSLDDWLESLKAGMSARVRRASAFALGRMGAAGQRAIPGLASRVRDDGEPSVRDMAAQAIGEIVLALEPNPAGVWDSAGPILLARLRDETDPRVKRSIIYALGAFGKASNASIPALKSALSDSDASVRQNAAWALGRLGSGVKDLAACLRDPDALVRRDAAQALGEIAKSAGRKEASPAGDDLIAMVSAEKDGVVRKAAVAALASLTGPEHAASCDKLYSALTDSDPETRRAAAFALLPVGGDHAKKAMPVLQEALLDDSDSDNQAQAAIGLEKLGPAAAPAAAALARALTKADDPTVRLHCAMALGQLKGKCSEEGVIALAAALKPRPARPGAASSLDKEEKVRHMAAEALSHIGYSTNKAAMPAIRDTIAKDPKDNNNVRLRLVEALFYVTDLDGEGVTPSLVKVLGETSAAPDAMLVRYNCARVLARAFHEKAPDKTVDVLMHMLHNRKIKVFYETRASGDGGLTEGSKGTTGTAERTGGDARFMAAEALAELGAKASGNEAVMDALRKAKTSRDPKLKEEATKAVTKLGGD